MVRTTQTIAYRSMRGFNAMLHQQIIDQRLGSEMSDPMPAYSNGSMLKLVKYISTENFGFHIGFGRKEPAHIDLPGYRGLMIVDPAGWVLKNPADKGVFQQPGDLILLNTGLRHEIVWDRFHPKPKTSWVYLFVDFYGQWQSLGDSIEALHRAAIEIDSDETLAQLNIKTRRRNID